MPTFSLARHVGTLLRRTFVAWTQDHASQFGAAMAYYMFFSMAPLLVLSIALAGAFFGADAAEGRIVAELQHLIGRDGAAAIQELVRRARGSEAGVTIPIAGLGVLIWGAMQVFNSLQTALNAMWGVRERPAARKGIVWDLIDLAKKRALSFGMVVIIGLLLVLSLLASAALSAVGAYLTRLGTESAEVFLLRVSEIAISVGSLTCLLAVIYKMLPDARIAWRDVWFGAVVTSSLLTLGRLVIGWYLGNRNVASVYGAAGSLIVILIWVYYCSQILLFGAKMTQVYASEFGSRRRGGDS
jgi:membrane protein